jgi:hypothetical protein
MRTAAEKVVSEAMGLPPTLRAFVAEKLIESLDAPGGLPCQPSGGRKPAVAVRRWTAEQFAFAEPRLFSRGLARRLDEDVRCCLTKTFLFGVLFRELPNRVVVVAVMHLHREPGYWKNR